MMNFSKSFSLFLFLALFLSCSETESQPQLSSDKELTSFSFKKETNPELNESIHATIRDSEIRLTIHEFVKSENLIATFEHNGQVVYAGSTAQVSGVTANNFKKDLKYVVMAEDKSSQSYTVVVDWIEDEKPVIPHIHVDIENNREVVEKKTELKAVIRIEGKGKYDDFEGSSTIRGRGNSTWGMPKKPYRLTLDKKTSLMGLAAFKDWVLLNEYLDGSMLYNAIPYKAGQLLNIPYTNTIIPVELTINGEYRGIYAFTEHKEVGKGRIDIGDDGLLFELDEYFDEDWKFKSEKYKLPVMIQFPKSKNMSDERLTEIETDFNTLEQLVFDDSFPDNNYLDHFDDLSFVNYMIVYQLTLNQEIKHPKSTYMNKLAGGKYRMGIVWDFDWGYGYEDKGSHYTTSSASYPLFWSGTKPGTQFFGRLMSDPHMQKLFKERWLRFKAEKMDELKEYIGEYADIVALALEKDHNKWGQRSGSQNPETNLNRLLNWLELRIAYIDGWVAKF